MFPVPVLTPVPVLRFCTGLAIVLDWSGAGFWGTVSRKAYNTALIILRSFSKTNARTKQRIRGRLDRNHSDLPNLCYETYNQAV